MLHTAAIEQIPTHGGFNFSEFNIQDHKPGSDPRANFNEQDRRHVMFAGRNPLNPPSSTSERKPTFGLNQAYGWREQNLGLAAPAQVPLVERTFEYQRVFSGADPYALSRAVRHGWAQNDPALSHMLDERKVAPGVKAPWHSQSDAFLHTDVGVPSVVGLNYPDNSTYNVFPKHLRKVVRGTHDHTNLRHERTPEVHNFSHASSATHHTRAHPGHQEVTGFRATTGPLERPLLLSDLPPPPTPQLFAGGYMSRAMEQGRTRTAPLYA